MQSKHRGGRHSRLEVVYTLLGFAHFAGIGEEPGGEKWSVEVCGRSGVDSGCSRAR
jgi:hypothetical protein